MYYIGYVGIVWSEGWLFLRPVPLIGDPGGFNNFCITSTKGLRMIYFWMKNLTQ